MGIIPDKTASGYYSMVRANDQAAWWESSTRKAKQMDSSDGLDEWSKAAGLDFTVAAMESGYFNEATQTWHKEPHRRTIVRTDNAVGLGHFTKHYKIHQPAEILAFFSEFLLADPRFTLSTMGSMKGGALIWALAKFQEERAIAGDKHALYCLLGTSYNGTWATFASATAIRAVCQNTVEATIYAEDSAASQTFRIPHSVAFDSVKREQALVALAKTSAQFDAYKAFAESLQVIKMTRDETVAFLTKLVTGKDSVNKDDFKPGARIPGIMSDVVDSLSLTLAETGEFNAWTAINAVTRYVDHERGTKRDLGAQESEGQARLFSANFGSGAKVKRDAVELMSKQYPGAVRLMTAEDLVAA